MQIRLPITNYSIVWHLPPLADPGPCRLAIQLALLSSFNCLSSLPATSLRRAASLAWGEIIEAVSARSRQARRTLQIPPWKDHPGISWPSWGAPCRTWCILLLWPRALLIKTNDWVFKLLLIWPTFMTMVCCTRHQALLLQGHFWKYGHSIAGKQGKQACNLIYQGVAVDDQFPSFHLNTFFTTIHWDIDLVQLLQ